MSILTWATVESNSLSGLKTDIAAAILAGKQPMGEVFRNGSSFCQVVITGTVQESIADMQAAIVANTALDTAQNAVSAFTAGVAEAISVTRGRKKLAKTSDGTYTLAAPAADGVEIDIYAGTAHAHVITATGLIDDGTTGGAKTTITLASFVGACITLFGSGGHWIVKSSNHVTSIA